MSIFTNNFLKNKIPYFKNLYTQRILFLFVLPGIVWFLIFSYIPMAGVVIAFKDYDLIKGFWSSPWAGLKYFRQFMNSYYFPIIMRNTIGISMIKLVFGFPVPIIFALLLNEVKNRNYLRVVQTVSYLPHFLSWVVVMGVLGKMLSIDGGVINEMLIKFGFQPIQFFAEPKAMWPIAYFSEIWKQTGWNSIIYLAALANIDPELYDAAKVDGASKIQRIWYINLPGIQSTIIILLILSAGNIFNSNFDQLYLLGTSPVIESVEVIDTYIYRNNIQNIQYSLGAAVGLMKSVMNIALVFVINKFCKRVFGEGIW